MQGLPFFTRRLSVLLMLAITGAATPIQAAPPTPPPPPIPLFPRSTEVDSLSHLPGAESPVTAPEAIDALSLYPWSRLTFQSYRNLSNWEIFIGNDDGSGQTQLTFDGASDLHPRLNRGATRIAFASRRTGNYEIFTMNPDGSGLTQITFNSTDDVQPYWSPDGSKIAFQAYRDGQPEVYVMSADGSGQVRLTYNADYDGEPAWSPDGSKIAFVSKRTAGAGDYFIWVMNADGSNQTQLSGWAYSEGPVWSPDGTRIAYDAAGPDYWQNLHVMNANGSNDQVVFDEGGWADAWARSWSPDSRYVAFTRIYYVQCGSNLCWTNAYLDAWDSQTGGVIRLSHTGYDWRPDWQSTDLAAPSSVVNPLPAESPGPFTVSWNGSDNLSGIGSYDVQVRDGSGGTWTNWQTGTTATSAAYPGVGGHTYYFRVRARDKAGNIEAYPTGHDAITTVEALAPNSAVQPLVEFSKNSVIVKWNGADLGGSGITAYDVQFQDVTTGGSWTDWQSGVVTKSATFTGIVGHTYAFRSQATDEAQNVEDWPTSGDAQTTFYAWAISGVVRDNTGAPVSDATITTVPDAARVFTSTVDGVYAAYVLTPTGAYAATWAKLDYGELPATNFVSDTDANQIEILPPLDNLLLDGGFESGDFGVGNWETSGIISPTVLNGVRHTGEYSAWMGGPLFEPKIVIAMEGANRDEAPRLTTDSANRVQVVWENVFNGVGRILFAQRDSDQNWSSPQDISMTSEPAYLPLTVMGVDDRLHVIWTVDGQKIVYRQKDADGTWSVPLTITELPGFAYATNLVLDVNGNLHLLWVYDSTGISNYGDIHYSRRSPNGVWSSPRNITNLPFHSIYPKFAADSIGTLHLVWLEHNTSGFPHNRYYYTRSTDGVNWSAPVEIILGRELSGDIFQLAVDSNRIVHVVHAFDTGTIYYRQIASNGIWSSPLDIGLDGYGTLIVAPNGTIHLVGVLVDYISKYYYLQRWPSGEWTREAIPYQTGLGNLQHVLLKDGSLELVWGSYTVLGGVTSTYDVFYARRYPDGAWMSPINLTNNLEFVYVHPNLAVSKDGATHIVWPDNSSADPKMSYVGSSLAPQDDNVSLSQSVMLPITMTTPVLSMRFNLEGISAEANNAFSIRVNNGLTSTTVFSTTASLGNWAHQWLDLSAWSGQTITLTFSARQAASYPYVRVHLDEISLGSAYPDLWATLNSPLITQPGNTITYSLTYGNQGGAPAPGAQLTLTLPAELTFVDASLPPLTSTSEIVWEVGDLSAKSGPYTIVVTATVVPTTTFFSTLTSTVSLSTSSAELETANNGAQASTFIAYQIFFPVIRRD